MGLRVKEDGGSEGPSVMEGTEVEAQRVVRQHHLTRKRADFRPVSLHERAWQSVNKEEKRDDDRVERSSINDC